jgi:hypothetical protein
MQTILNLTQHAPTAEQIEAGVFDWAERRGAITQLLTFSSVPTKRMVEDRAFHLALVAASAGVSYAMIGGASYLMGPLVEALKNEGIKPMFSFTERVSVETTLPDGSVSKTSVFKHVGFVSG